MPTSSDSDRADQSAPTDGEFEELAIAEDELIDAYIRNDLSPDERNLFKNALLGSPQLRERLHFAKLLAKEVSSAFPGELVEPIPKQSHHPSGVEDSGRRKWKDLFGLSLIPRPALRLAFGALVVLILLGGVALFAGWWKLNEQTQKLAAERKTLELQKQELEKAAADQRLRSDQQTAELYQAREQLDQDRKRFETLRQAQVEGEKTRSQNSDGLIATLFLSPNLTRSSIEPTELPVGPRISKIKIELGLEAVDYPRYHAVIKDSHQSVVYQRRVQLARSSKALILRVPASSLPSGSYTVELSGIASSGAAEVVSEYRFSVSRAEQ